VPISMQAFTGQRCSSSTSRRWRTTSNSCRREHGRQRPGQNEVFHCAASAPVRRPARGAARRALAQRCDLPWITSPGSSPIANLDIYAIDLNSHRGAGGPQGAVGAGAEAGAMRYITNEPKLDKTEFNVEPATA